ncbi:hypothetical protein LIER_40349 [Lithospermum erythrorhizon]|uniref:Replication factor A C-terminal domain-containing protein n=1 Tax=Lithospermum erythrorhizon TaxID=34254 RepID=A0AAV3QT91_LITER
MGVIIAVEEPTTVITINGLRNIQRFTFVDIEKIPISVTLWEEMPEIESPALIKAANTLSVVIAKRLNMGTHNDQSATISKEIITGGDKKIVTIAQINSIARHGDYWIRGLLHISEENQRLFYIGCSNCNSKISDNEEGIKYTCYVCQKEVFIATRPLVFMFVTDTTATNLSKLINLGETYDLDSIRSDFEGNVYLMLLRRNFGKHNNGQRKLLLIMYLEETNSEEGCQSSNQINTFEAKDEIAHNLGKQIATESSHSPLSPLKRQMKKSAKKKLIMSRDDDVNQDSSSHK